MKPQESQRKLIRDTNIIVGVEKLSLNHNYDVSQQPPTMKSLDYIPESKHKNENKTTQESTEAI